jgi:hypothetical protein
MSTERTDGRIRGEAEVLFDFSDPIEGAADVLAQVVGARQGLEAAAAAERGACRIRKGTSKECFPDVTRDECIQIAEHLQATEARFVRGKSCA